MIRSIRRLHNELAPNYGLDVVARPATPAEIIINTLYANGEEGAYYDFTRADTMFVETTGASATTPAGIDDVVGTVASISGDGSYLTAPSNAARPLRKEWGLLNDKIDDRMLAGLTFTSKRAVNVIIVTQDYVSVLNEQEYQTAIHEIPRADLVAWGCIDRDLTDGEIAKLATYYGVANGGRWSGYFAIRNNTSAAWGIVTQGNATWDIDWGDGTLQTGLTSSATQVTRTYTGATSTIVRYRSAAVRQVRGTPGGITYSFGVMDAPSGLTFLEVGGFNTLTGDIANAPSGLTFLQVGGSNTLTMPTTTFWKSSGSIRTIDLRSNLSTAHVDNLLIAASTITTWTNERRITLNVSNSPRSSASDAAVTTLEGNGVTVQTA